MNAEKYCDVIGVQTGSRCDLTKVTFLCVKLKSLLIWPDLMTVMENLLCLFFYVYPSLDWVKDSSPGDQSVF